MAQSPEFTVGIDAKRTFVDKRTPSGHRVAQRFFHFGTLFALATWKVDAIICVVAQAGFSEARPYAPARLH